MRQPVLDYLKSQIQETALEGPALDACCGPTEHYDLAPIFPRLEIRRQDQAPLAGVDLVCDVHQLKDVESDTQAVVFCLEALEHLANPAAAIAAFRRILRPGGTLFLTTVMDFPIHRHPQDFWRFCPEGLALLLDGFQITDFTVEGHRIHPRGLWVTALRQTGDFRRENQHWALHPNRVHLPLSRWFAFKERIHKCIAGLFFR